MSTRSTLHSSPGSIWWLEEDMINDVTMLILRKPILQMTNDLYSDGADGAIRLEVMLPADVLDAIAELHRNKQLPHQRGTNP